MNMRGIRMVPCQLLAALGYAQEPSAVWKSLQEPVMDSEKATAVNNLVLVRDSIRLTLSEGLLQFVNPANGLVYGAAFAGRGRVEIRDYPTRRGGLLQFWKVAVRPGKPFVFGRWREKFLFGLPGNPVSAFVTFLLLARPALRRWQGAADVALPTHTATLAEPLANPGERRHFMRVRVDAQGRVHSAGAQGSHALLSLAAANGLVDVPPGTTLALGTSVAVIRWT